MIPQRLSVLLCVGCWYGISFIGIILNKSLLSPGNSSGTPGHVQPSTLALVQTVSTVVFGAIAQALFSSNAAVVKSKQTATARAKFVPLLILGILRFLSVVLGLVSLQHVAASFTETVKASSPFFTVLAAFLLNGERTERPVLISLLLVAGGLMCASSSEISFTMIGFAAALLANAVECVQHVFCKGLLQPDRLDGKPSFTHSELQYYSAIASLIVQLPIYIGLYSQGALASEERAQPLLFCSGFVYWAQSALAFRMMSLFSPVTVSVLNTVKRALIISYSAVYFGNVITPASKLGTFVTLVGSGLYSWLRCCKSLNKVPQVEDDSSTGSSSLAGRPALRQGHGRGNRQPRQSTIHPRRPLRCSASASSSFGPPLARLTSGSFGVCVVVGLTCPGGSGFRNSPRLVQPRCHPWSGEVLGATARQRLPASQAIGQLLQLRRVGQPNCRHSGR